MKKKQKNPLGSWLGCSPAPIYSELMANGLQRFSQKFSSGKLTSCAMRMFGWRQHTGHFPTPHDCSKLGKTHMYASYSIKAIQNYNQEAWEKHAQSILD